MFIVLVTESDGAKNSHGPIATKEVAVLVMQFLANSEEDNASFEVIPLQDMSDFFMELREYRS